MSLRKEIISENGAITTYHRIGCIIKNGSTLNITVNSYTDETYRDAEKEMMELLKNRASLITELSVLTAKAQDDMTEQEMVREDEIQESFRKIGTAQRKYNLFETDMTLNADGMEGISFQDIYDQLKKETEMFIDAEDC